MSRGKKQRLEINTRKSNQEFIGLNSDALANLQNHVLQLTRKLSVTDKEQINIWYHQPTGLAVGQYEFNWALSHEGISDLRLALRNLELVKFAQITSNDEEHTMLEEVAQMIILDRPLGDMIKFLRGTKWNTADEKKFRKAIDAYGSEQLNAEINCLKENNYSSVGGWVKLC